MNQTNHMQRTWHSSIWYCRLTADCDHVPLCISRCPNFRGLDEVPHAHVVDLSPRSHAHHTQPQRRPRKPKSTTVGDAAAPSRALSSSGGMRGASTKSVPRGDKQHHHHQQQQPPSASNKPDDAAYAKPRAPRRQQTEGHRGGARGGASAGGARGDHHQHGRRGGKPHHAPTATGATSNSSAASSGGAPLNWQQLQMLQK
jgi:hypothetical protein